MLRNSINMIVPTVEKKVLPTPHTYTCYCRCDLEVRSVVTSTRKKKKTRDGPHSGISYLGNHYVVPMLYTSRACYASYSTVKAAYYSERCHAIFYLAYTFAMPRLPPSTTLMPA